MTADEIDDAVLVGRIEDLADRLHLRGRKERDADLSEAGDLLRLMALAYSGKWPQPDDAEPELGAANDNAARGLLH